MTNGGVNNDVNNKVEVDCRGTTKADVRATYGKSGRDVGACRRHAALAEIAPSKGAKLDLLAYEARFTRV